MLSSSIHDRGTGRYLESLGCQAKVVNEVQNLIIEGPIQANAVNACIAMSLLRDQASHFVFLMHLSMSNNCQLQWTRNKGLQIFLV